MVVIAFLISVPLAWWAGTNFLEQYPVRIMLPLWSFPLAGIGSLVLTLIIVSTQAFKAARSNPVDSLRSE